MTERHLVQRAAQAGFAAPEGWAAGATGYRRWTVVGEDAGAVHTGFGVCELDPGGSVPAHVHSFEESFHLLSGTAVLTTPDGSHLLSEGDYGVLPVALPHAWRVEAGSPGPARWAEMQGPQPREAFDGDTFLVPPLDESRPARAIDVRDPRTYRFGTIRPGHMDPARQSQDLLAVSASMRTALLVYGGINVKQMVDSDLGAVLTTMFMVQYDPDGATTPHDHPFEETYLILEGAVEASFDGRTYLLEAGDVAWAGVGCPHAFRNAGGGRLRWLETQAPAPPPRYSYRFARDWNHLRDVLGGPS